MKREILSEITEALKNNDLEKVNQLEKKYNIKINVNRTEMPIDKTLFNNNNIRVIREKINPNEMVNRESNNYFRGIPCNNDLFVIYLLASNHGLMKYESNIFGACLLRWIKEKKVSYTVLKKGLFKKKYTKFYFYDNLVFMDPLEEKVYSFIKNISNNNELDINEFNKWLGQNGFELNQFLQGLKKSAHSRAIDLGLMIVNSISNLPPEVNDSNNVVVKKRVESSSYILTPKFREYLQQVVDFKKYIKEFTLIHEKDILDIMLWGDYLAVSYLLGISNEVMEQINDLIPKFKTKNKSMKIVVKK